MYKKPSIHLEANLSFPSICPFRQFITDSLTYKNPKYESAKKHAKNPLWAVQNMDPYVRYWKENVSRGEITVPIGVRDQLFSYCNQCSIGCSVVDSRTLGIRPEERRPLIEQLVLRPSQEKAYAAAVRTIGMGGTGIIQMPTGCGKTIMGFHLAHQARQNTLFVTHTKDLMYQTAESYEHLFGKKPGLIGDGEYELDDHFTIAIIDSVYSKKQYDEWNDMFGFVIFDEVHRLPTKKSHEAMANLTAKYKLGLSATLNRGDGLGSAISQFFGSVVHRVTIQEAMDEGSLVPLEVECRETSYIPSQSNSSNKTGFKILEKEAALDTGRNREIARVVEEKIAEGHSSILVLNSLEQCRLLYDKFKGSDVVSAIFTGEQDRDERREIMTKVKSGEINALLTVQLAGMGLDIPRATHLLMDRKISEPLPIEQIVGRVVRACKPIGKTKAILTDIYDVNCKPFASQTRKRFDVYNKFIVRK